MEVEDTDMYKNPHLCFYWLAQQYGMSDEKTRIHLIGKANVLRLNKCNGVTDFLNQHREVRQDLLTAGMAAYTEDTMISNIFMGLPSVYDSIRDYWDWMRAMDPANTPRAAVLFERLMMKEAELEKARAPRNRSGTTNGDTDKQTLKCTFDQCGLNGTDRVNILLLNNSLAEKVMPDVDMLGFLVILGIPGKP